MRIFCPAIVLSSSLLVVPPSQTWPGGPHPLLCSGERPRPPRSGVSPFPGQRATLLDLVGVAPDSPGPAGRRAGGSPGSVRTQTGPRVQESLFSGQVIL